MSNVVQIKRGAAAPKQGDLAPYELGYCTDEKALYIGQDSGAPVAVKAAEANQANQANQATQLTNARTIRTKLNSTSAASFDGTKNITPGVTGTLPITNGGTGATTAADALTTLGVNTAITTATENAYNYIKILTSSDDLDNVKELGIYFYDSGSVPANAPYTSNSCFVEVLAIPEYTSTTTRRVQRAMTHSNSKNTIAVRGLSGSTWGAWKESFFVAMGTIALPISQGGTGATTAAGALTNLGVDLTKIQATEIPTGADLNNYRTPGFYRSAKAANVISNVPAALNTNTAFELTVTSISQWNDYCTQLVKHYGNNNYYVRTQTSYKEPYEWTEWSQLVTNTNHTTKLASNKTLNSSNTSFTLTDGCNYSMLVVSAVLDVSKITVTTHIPVDLITTTDKEFIVGNYTGNGPEAKTFKLKKSGNDIVVTNAGITGNGVAASSINVYGIL